MITTDQQRADTLGVYGSKLGATPNIDRLAAEGVTFREARCQHPYCQPSRWTILSGQHPRTHGVWTNGVDPTEAEIEAALSTRLTARGIATALVGKAHLASHGVFRRRASPYMEAVVNAVRMPDDWHGPYMGFDDVALLALGHFPFGFGPAPLGLHYGRFLARGGPLERFRRFVQASPRGAIVSGEAPQTWASALPEQLHPTTWIADETIARLKKLQGTRFFLWASFADPHHPFDPPSPWCFRYDPRDMPLPVRDPDELRSKPPVQERFSKGLSPLARWLNVPGGNVTDRELAVMMAAYYGSVAQIDYQVGRILRALDEVGMTDETLVVFASDHGELLGDHGLLFKGPFHYDGLLKVPLVLRGPRFRGGRQVHEPVGLIDVAPTIDTALGFSLRSEYEGRDLSPLAAGRGKRDAVLTENLHTTGFVEHVQTITTRDYKLNRHVGRDYGELYVRADDPGERHNRWNDLSWVRSSLEAELDRKLPPARELRKAITVLPA